MEVLGVWLFCTTLLKEEEATPGRSRASSLLLVLCISDPILLSSFQKGSSMEYWQYLQLRVN